MGSGGQGVRIGGKTDSVDSTVAQPMRLLEWRQLRKCSPHALGRRVVLVGVFEGESMIN